MRKPDVLCNIAEINEVLIARGFLGRCTWCGMSQPEIVLKAAHKRHGWIEVELSLLPQPTPAKATQFITCEGEWMAFIKLFQKNFRWGNVAVDDPNTTHAGNLCSGHGGLLYVKERICDEPP